MILQVGLSKKGRAEDSMRPKPSNQKQISRATILHDDCDVGDGEACDADEAPDNTDTRSGRPFGYWCDIQTRHTVHFADFAHSDRLGLLPQPPQ